MLMVYQTVFYSKGMVPSDLWESVKKRFGRDGGSSFHSVKEKDFYGNKFALWIDLRTHPDNGIHGGGSSPKQCTRWCKNRNKKKSWRIWYYNLLHVCGC